MTTAPSAGFVARLDAVARRLDAHAAGGGRRRLTSPDPATQERWDAGQVWAHLAEFIPYWIAQARIVLSSPRDGAPFGRVKTDEARVAAIERDRSRRVDELAERLHAHREQLRAFLVELNDADWRRTGTHPKLGLMSMVAIVEDFLVGHLEEHADQLDELAASV
jgi:hypothetical protein